MSERFACRVLSQHRSTQRKSAVMVEDEAALMSAMVALALQYGRCGYRRIRALLRRDGWTVNVTQVERIWRRQGLKVPARQPNQKLKALDVIDVLLDLFSLRRVPGHNHSDNGPEFID